MEKIGIMGGTFDPIHIGHLLAAEEVRTKLRLDRVIFVPSGNPPFKSSTVHAKPHHRLIMCELACVDNPYFEVSDTEVRRDGVSYTVDTIKHFAQIYPHSQLFLIVGADVPTGFHKWKDFAEIIGLCEIVVTTRPGSDFQCASDYHQVEICNMDVSSSGVRSRLADGLSMRYLVHDAVSSYVYKNGLYYSEIENIRRILSTELSSQRFRHSLAVMDEAVKLGRHYHQDESVINKLRMAGLLHDCAKNMCEELSYDDIEIICNRNGIQLAEFFRERCDLAHSYAGMAYAAAFYGVTDPCVLSAIGSHTFGKPDMSFIDKAVYLADFIEPTRPQTAARNEARRLAYTDMDNALVYVLRLTIERNNARGRLVYPESLRALEYITGNKLDLTMEMEENNG